MHISLSLVGALLLAQAYAQGCPAVRPVTTVITVSALPSSTPSVDTAAPTSTSIARTYPADVVDQLRDSSITKLASYLKQNPASNGCTLETASIRKEWTDLSVAQREEYIAAVKCLQSAPSKSSATEIPGARSRFDDFVAVHIQQTDSIHNTANFLSWHRYFVFTYEKALREECGYTGYHPYWNWDRYASDPASSPLFNGNASSLSGNSVNGGCVTTGPFANFQVNLGPGKSLTYNPRCMTRAISKSYAATTTADKTYSLITGSSSIGSFQNTLQAVPGVHSGGHFTIGGTPGGDIYASPGDPAFYLHHAMVDRVWWIWQMQDLATRLTAVAGSVAGSSRQGSASDTVALGVNAGSVTISELLNTLGGLDGEFCYIYV
ncbi:putative tyrosinase central domain-containing protein [Phaeoacremonium minimum UCRPA7]|uniref:Putative tyrosinase central domain-containing protein n=1 Tax=Phaeoacremonium minimum (strain UCR-PA7) TaxID=1286976 RepID=R8BXZ3_PHAM7|nr:putative tyrosinase central domain-containing protein [Phaeoacremonium minimum UCRPA7]EOO04223.1 putative tyrosinase central domain-containing protein [Phaeoacremonium minimum UCRPA7]